MLASICRRRRFLHALHQISAGGDGSARNRIHPGPSTVLLSHLSSLNVVAPNSEPCPTTTSCGISPATAAVRKFRVRDTDEADAVRDLFREYGFSEEEVTRTVRRYPRLLTLDPDRILRSKLDFLLISLGLQPRVIAVEPRILSRSLDKHLAPCVDFLHGILGTEDNLRVAFSRMPRALMADVDNNMRPAVEAFRRHSLSEESIAKLLLMDLFVLMVPIDRIAEVFGILKDLGTWITDTNFLNAVRVLCFLGRETWQRKVALFGSFGVTEDLLIRAFKTQPTILAASEEVIEKKVRFFLDVLKLDLNSIMQRPIALSLSLEKCIKPRCAVLSILIREGKLERKLKLIAAFARSAKDFSERFVLKHADEVPDVVKAFEGKIKFEGFTDRELEFFGLK